MTAETTTGHSRYSLLLSILSGVTGSSILFATYITVPFVGFISGMLSPLPLLLLRIHKGRKAGIAALLLSTAIIAVAFGNVTALLYIVQVAMVALFIPELFEKSHSISSAITYSTILTAIIVSASFGALYILNTFDINAAIKDEISKSIVQAAKLYEESGLKGEDLETAKTAMRQAADLIIKLYPAIIAISYIFLAGINIALAKRFSPILKSNESFGKVEDYKAPENLIWLLIASGFGLASPFPELKTPAMNILAVTIIPYLFQGWGVAATIISRQPFASVVRFFVTMAMLFQPYLLGIVAIIGIFDLWGDFRAPKKQENL